MNLNVLAFPKTSVQAKMLAEIGEEMRLLPVFFVLYTIGLPFTVQSQQPEFDPNANLKTGPEAGQKIPAFSALDQAGRTRNFDSLKGPQGLVLFFNRSVDW